MKISFRDLYLATLLVLSVFLIAGCLTPEKKEYSFKLHDDGTGSGTVRYVNLVSQDDDNQDVSYKDFTELVTDYIEGNKFEEENPEFNVTDKQLYEENDMLIVEFSFTFTSWNRVGFLLTPGCDCCPVYYCLDVENAESLTSSNGEDLQSSDGLPLVMFPIGTKEFEIKTTLLSDLSGTHPLLDHYRNWKK